MNRRDFLATAAAAAASGTVVGRAIGQVSERNARVIQVSSNHVVRGRVVHRHILGEMLDLTLREVTGRPTSEQAWKSLLRSEDVIGIKFNQSGAEGLGVRDKFAAALITSLVASGFEPRQVVPIEVASDTYSAHGVIQPAGGWDGRVTRFGSGEDQLADVLNQVTAIINVPFLKTHNIAGITCCLKNLSHGLIKHPARFHRGHCSPFIGDIVALPAIRDKIRLHLVNALRIVYDRGPEARDDDTWDGGIILAGTDPVAVDSVGLEIINSQRAILAMSPIDREGDRAAHLAAAAKRGLGQFQRRRIDVTKLRV